MLTRTVGWSPRWAFRKEPQSTDWNDSELWQIRAFRSNFGHAIDHIPHVAWCIDVNVDSLTALCGRQRKVAKRHALFQYFQFHAYTSDLHREAGPTFLSTHCSSSVFGTGTSAILPVVAFLSACDEVFDCNGVLLVHHWITLIVTHRIGCSMRPVFRLQEDGILPRSSILSRFFFSVSKSCRG